MTLITNNLTASYKLIRIYSIIITKLNTNEKTFCAFVVFRNDLIILSSKFVDLAKSDRIHLIPGCNLEEMIKYEKLSSQITTIYLFYT